MKKVLATLGLVSIVAMNSAYAATITGNVTGGTTNNDVIWDGTYNGTNNATGSTTVLVTAEVAPILTMAISTGAINFGTLTLGDNNQSLSFSTATNAEGGVNVAVASNGLQSATKYIGTYGATATGMTTGNDFYKISSTSTATTKTVLAETDVANTQNVFTATDVANSNQVTTVNLKATIDAQTEADNYGDTLTFTVTGNF
ncbi:MAG: hypothetical protein PHR68_02890 [Candidatus Gracilibacteria bacterium]|nr:hypothetical protein [Candidatus Gracilibacteria bacterium]